MSTTPTAVLLHHFNYVILKKFNNDAQRKANNVIWFNNKFRKTIWCNRWWRSHPRWEAIPSILLIIF